MEDQTRFLTVPETAKLLRINRGRAYAMANDGTLPGVIRLGRTIRVDRAQLIAGLRENPRSSTSKLFPTEN
jgi:excisionase family DNA binding protein